MFKIVNGYEDVDRNMFFKLKEGSRTRRHKAVLSAVVEHTSVYSHRYNISMYSSVDSRNCDISLTYQNVIRTMPWHRIRTVKWVSCQLCDVFLYGIMCLLYFVSYYIKKTFHLDSPLLSTVLCCVYIFPYIDAPELLTRASHYILRRQY